MICNWEQHGQLQKFIMNDPNEESLDKSCAESVGNESFLSAQYERPDQSSRDQSLDSSAFVLPPTFEFSSPISSIASNCSSPERDQTLQTRQPLDEQECSDNYMSIEEIQSIISPPYNTPPKGRDGLETIFENCYLETGPGTPTTPRNIPRRVRINLNNFDEFKENVLSSHRLDDQMNPSSTGIFDFSELRLEQDLSKFTVNSE